MPHEAKDYKERLGKKVKDMTAEEKREYGRLRVKDHREKKKSAKVAPKPKKKIKLMKPKEAPKPKKKIKLMKPITNDGNIPNSKMKCFMRTAKNGKPYRACAVPEKKKAPKKQVRDKPRPESERKLPYVSAYKNKFHRGNAKKKRDKDKKK